MSEVGVSVQLKSSARLLFLSIELGFRAGKLRFSD